MRLFWERMCLSSLLQIPAEVPPERDHLQPPNSLRIINFPSLSLSFSLHLYPTSAQPWPRLLPVRGQLKPWDRPGGLFLLCVLGTVLPSTAMCTEIISSPLARHSGTLSTLILCGCLSID